MKEATKTKTLDTFYTLMQEKFPHIKESDARKIANELIGVAQKMSMENADGFAKLHKETLLELEQHRTQFRKHIELIEKHTNGILESFKRQGYLKPETDPKTGKMYLKARTSLTTELVVYLNKLNDSVFEFYKNVYKIESYDQKGDSGFQQISLF